MSYESKNLLPEKGTVSQCSCPYTPQQNRGIKHKNHHLLMSLALYWLSSLFHLNIVWKLCLLLFKLITLPYKVLNLKFSYIQLITKVLAMIIFIHVVMFFCITPSHVINLLLSLENMFSWVIVLHKMVLSVIIHVLINFMFLEILFSLRISISFIHMLIHLLFLLFFVVLRIVIFFKEV